MFDFRLVSHRAIRNSMSEDVRSRQLFVRHCQLLFDRGLLGYHQYETMLVRYYNYDIHFCPNGRLFASILLFILILIKRRVIYLPNYIFNKP